MFAINNNKLWDLTLKYETTEVIYLHTFVFLVFNKLLFSDIFFLCFAKTNNAKLLLLYENIRTWKK